MLRAYSAANRDGSICDDPAGVAGKQPQERAGGAADIEQPAAFGEQAPHQRRLTPQCLLMQGREIDLDAPAVAYVLGGKELGHLLLRGPRAGEQQAAGAAAQHVALVGAHEQ